MNVKMSVLLAGLILTAPAAQVWAQEAAPIQATQKSGAESSSGYVPVSSYDPARDAAKDLDEAVAEARRTGKHVLLEVGGQWCSWCHTMHRFYEENPSLLTLRENNYINLVINYSPENENKKVLSRYPKIEGFPHLFVLDANGKLLRSQGTSELEDGKSYSLTRFTVFLKKWAPGGVHKSR